MAPATHPLREMKFIRNATRAKQATTNTGTVATSAPHINRSNAEFCTARWMK